MPSTFVRVCFASATAVSVVCGSFLFGAIGCTDVGCPNGTRVGSHCVVGDPTGATDDPSLAAGQASADGRATSGTNGGGATGGSAIGMNSSSMPGSSTAGASMSGPMSGAAAAAGQRPSGTAGSSSTAGPGSNPAAGRSGNGASGSGGPSTCAAVPEDCDNLDNDCDGKVDEGAMRACGNPMPPCVQGMQMCVAGQWSPDCVGEVSPAMETCDGIDNDCNGIADEGCLCTDGEWRECGNMTPPCAKGVQTCAGGRWPMTCDGEIKPSAEQCDGIDNDCNGTPDDTGNALCSGMKCGGTLKCVQCLGDGDCANQPAATCKTNYCDTSTHRCAQKNADLRTGCSTVANGKCNQSGQCVGCIDNTDCPGQECSGTTCRKIAKCTDGTVDPGESCDDGNANNNDSCVGCKSASCGDGYWNKSSSSSEACEIGDVSSFGDGRDWDTWSCDTGCRRRFIYTPCTSINQSNTPDCPNSGCYADGYCYPYCSGAEGTSCTVEGGRSGICKRGWCWPTCTPGRADTCPPRSPCNSVADDNGALHNLCDFPA